MQAATVLGTLAALASTASFAPQAWKIIKSRSTADLSLGMYVLTVMGFSLWAIYGVLLGQWPLVASNVICLGLSAFILAMKLLPPRKKREVASFLTSASPTTPEQAPEATGRN